MLFAEAKKNGLEGIIAKRPGSPYEPDRRSGAWIKCKVLAEQEFVIGGFTPPQNSRQIFRGDPGRVLSTADGFATRARWERDSTKRRSGRCTRRSWRQRRASCPFADLPSRGTARFGAGMGPAEMSKVTWVRPTLVAQIRFAEWTDDGLLRQPVFLGLRADKRAREVVREAARGRGRAEVSRGRCLPTGRRCPCAILAMDRRLEAELSSWRAPTGFRGLVGLGDQPDVLSRARSGS